MPAAVRRQAKRPSPARSRPANAVVDSCAASHPASIEHPGHSDCAQPLKHAAYMQPPVKHPLSVQLTLNVFCQAGHTCSAVMPSVVVRSAARVRSACAKRRCQFTRAARPSVSPLGVVSHICQFCRVSSNHAPHNKSSRTASVQLAPNAASLRLSRPAPAPRQSPSAFKKRLRSSPRRRQCCMPSPISTFFTWP